MFEGGRYVFLQGVSIIPPHLTEGKSPSLMPYHVNRSLHWSHLGVHNAKCITEAHQLEQNSRGEI